VTFTIEGERIAARVKAGKESSAFCVKLVKTDNDLPGSRIPIAKRQLPDTDPGVRQLDLIGANVNVNGPSESGFSVNTHYICFAKARELPAAYDFTRQGQR
jgi:hypothetical protein